MKRDETHNLLASISAYVEGLTRAPRPSALVLPLIRTRVVGLAIVRVI